MTHDEQFVEQIVRHVMERVRAGSPSGGSQQAGCAVAESAHPSRSFFDDPVVTQELLEQRLNGQAEISIAPKSILTPSARDFLRSRKVRWTRSQSMTASRPSSATWSIVCLQTSDAIESAVSNLEASGTLCRAESRIQCVVDAAAWAVKTLGKSDTGAIILCDEPELIACRANRCPDVRAAAIQTAADLERVQRRLAANLVCFDAGQCSFFELRNLLRSAVSGPAPTVPEGWQELAFGH